MGELPDLAIIVIENLILPVVLDHVLADQCIVDYRGSDRLFVLLNLLLGLQLVLNVPLHRLSLPGFHHFSESNF